MRRNQIPIIMFRKCAGDYPAHFFIKILIFLGILGYFYFFIRVLSEGGMRDELKRRI